MKTIADPMYQKFILRWEEVMDIPPQRFGPFTGVYKRIVPSLKVMPWPLLVLCALLIVGTAYVFIGSAITFIVSLLQRGF